MSGGQRRVQKRIGDSLGEILNYRERSGLLAAQAGESRMPPFHQSLGNCSLDPIAADHDKGHAMVRKYRKKRTNALFARVFAGRDRLVGRMHGRLP